MLLNNVFVDDLKVNWHQNLTYNIFYTEYKNNYDGTSQESRWLGEELQSSLADSLSPGISNYYYLFGHYFVYYDEVFIRFWNCFSRSNVLVVYNILGVS